MLFVSLGFAWTAGYEPPSCLTQYSVAGKNFTITTAGTLYNCETYTRTTMPFKLTGTNDINNGTLEAENTTHMKTTGAGIATISLVPLPKSGNYTFEKATITCNETGNTTGTIAAYGKLTETGNAYNISNATGGQSILCNKTSTLTITPGSGFKYPFYNSTFFHGGSGFIKASGSDFGTCVGGNGLGNLSTGISYTGMWANKIGPIHGLYTCAASGTTTSATVFSDMQTKATITDPSAYCRLLLYFNNPYYGNIQLVPKLTYIPANDSFADFINSSDNSAYIPNNTITYVLDSITDIWYIVPAYTCASYSIIGSTSTLQYDPTATGNIGGGAVPIDVYINGSCSYNAASRVVTCTGTDSSATVTSLNLSTYALGNVTPNCANGTSGASATLTCTIPNVNGTYYAYFYGTDANLINHLFAYKEINIGSSSTTFGRSGYLGAIILVVVASTLITSSIAASMVLGCFGLFAALAFGIIPADGNSVVAILMVIVAFVLAYRLKV